MKIGRIKGKCQVTNNVMLLAVRQGQENVRQRLLVKMTGKCWLSAVWQADC